MINIPENLRTVIELAPVGSLIFNNLALDENSPYNQPAFILKEEAKLIAKIKDKADVGIRGFGVNIDDVYFVDIILGVKQFGGILSECTVNVANELGKNFLSAISNSDHYFIIFFDENMNQRIMKFENSGKDGFAQIEMHSKEWVIDWSMADFDMAKIKFNILHPDIEELFTK